MWAPPSVWRPTIRTWFSVLALGLVLWLFVRHTSLIFEVLAVLFAAYLLSLAVSPLAGFFARRGIPRAVTVVAFYVLAGAVLVLVARLLLPVIRMETMHLRRAGPLMLERALTVLRDSPILQDWLPPGPTLFQGLSQGADTLLGPAFVAVKDAGGLVLDLIVVLAVSFFFVTDDGIGDRLLYNWIPGAHRIRARRVATALRFRLTRWIWAQAAIALYFAVAFSAVLAFLRIPFALTIGVVGGLLELVPYVGGFVAFVLAILSALSVDPVLVIWVVVLYIVVIQIESHFLAPVLYGKATGVHPAAVLIALFVGGKAAGLPGLLFAVPVAVVVATLMQEAQRAWAEPTVEPTVEVTAVPAPLPVSELEKP